MQTTAIQAGSGERPISSDLKESLDFLRNTVQKVGGDDELMSALMRELAGMITEKRPQRSTLTEEQAQVLIESGVFTAESLADIEGRVERGELENSIRRTRLGAVTASVSAAEVAEHLHISESRVRHRQAKDLLYAFSAGGKRRYPMWQFVVDDLEWTVLPHLTTVVQAFPEGMHPASIQGLMTTPQRSLLIDGRHVTVPEWLTLGGEVQDVVDILDSLLMS